MNTKNNRRAQETRQRIQTALTEMLKEQELDQIFVLTDKEQQVYRCYYCETQSK